MTVWICATCAVEHPDSEAPPRGDCEICADERQYVPESGQRWTTLADLEQAGTTVEVAQVEPGLYGLSTSPAVGIGQRALLLQTEDGNLLWDPIGYIDDDAIEQVRALGGVAFVVASHPHMYGVQVEWSHAFDDAPVLVPEADKRWLMRPDKVVRFWHGTVDLLPHATLVQVGGHFPGSAAVHWSGAADGKGVILAGDTVMPARRVGTASFMRSFPNMIPLSQAAVRKIVANLEPYEYDRLYSNFGTVVRPNAKEGVKQSAERYIAWIRGDFDDDI
jgi:hypothetical protein